MLFITSLLLFQTRLCLIFQPLFSLTSWKPIYFTLHFILSLYSPRLSQYWYRNVKRSYQRMDYGKHFRAISILIYPVLTKLCWFISQSFRYHSPSFHSCQFLFPVIYKCVRISTQYIVELFCASKWIPFHTVIRIHVISLSSHNSVFAI